MVVLSRTLCLPLVTEHYVARFRPEQKSCWPVFDPLVGLTSCLSPANGTGGHFSELGSHQTAAGVVVFCSVKHFFFLASLTRSEYFTVYVITQLMTLCWVAFCMSYMFKMFGRLF